MRSEQPQGVVVSRKADRQRVKEIAVKAFAEIFEDIFVITNRDQVW